MAEPQPDALPAWQRYRRARGLVERMPGTGAVELEATPEAVAALRRRFGRRADEHRADNAELRAQVEAGVRRLTDAGAGDLLVEEPGALGGFGFEIDGALHNLETVEHGEALLALERGGVLADLPASATVLEVGSGWGGLAHRVKRLRPDVTYLVAADPRSLVLSAVYLPELHPGARCAFYGEDAFDAALAGGRVDFAFLPAGAAPEVRPRHLGLTILGRAAEAELSGSLALAHELRCPYVYTREPGIATLAEPWYWCHEVPVIPARRLRLGEVAAGMASAAQSRYRHVVGWRRLLPAGRPAPRVSPGAPL